MTGIWATSKDGKIQYVSLTLGRLRETIEILRTSFFKHENVCKAVGLPDNPDAIAEMDDFVITTAKHGVSLIAIDKNTDKVVGAILNKIQHKSTPSKEFYAGHAKMAKYPETKAIYEFLTSMEDSVDPFTPFNADCLMELVFLGVSPDYSGRGIGYTLCEASIKLATQLYKGINVKISLDHTGRSLEPRPQVVTALFTTFKTQRIGRKLGFEILKTISCEDLSYDGKSYASILGNETPFFTAECKRLV